MSPCSRRRLAISAVPLVQASETIELPLRSLCRHAPSPPHPPKASAPPQCSCTSPLGDVRNSPDGMQNRPHASRRRTPPLHVRSTGCLPATIPPPPLSDHAAAAQHFPPAIRSVPSSSPAPRWSPMDSDIIHQSRENDVPASKSQQIPDDPHISLLLSVTDTCSHRYSSPRLQNKKY